MGGTNSPDIDRYGALLVELHEAVVAGDASSPSDQIVEASRQIDTHLADRLASAEVCLRLLERMRLGHTATETPDSPRTNAPRSIGRFEIQSLLGEGTYGVVYLAQDPDLQRQVAIKVPRPEVVLSEPLRHRFLREAEAAAALDHPHIVPVYEAGQADGVYYMVMAYSPGSTLSQWLHQQPQLPFASDAARLVAKLADAVAHAHSRGVLHRDLKPSNVLMQVRGGPSTAANPRSDEVPQQGGCPRSGLPLSVFVPLVTDFGLAKFIGNQSAQTHTSAIVGSPAYMAPEQASGRNQDVGASADVYALGAILYELLTGRAPFVEESVMATLDAVRTRLPPAPSRLRPGVPRDLEAICMKCLEKAPASRYRTAAELYDDLTRFLLHEPIVARRVSHLERFARWCRRDPLVATLSAAVALLAVCSTAAAFLLARSRNEALAHLAATTSAKEAALSAARDANIAHAHAALRSGNSGHRVESWRALRAAMHNAVGLQLDDEHRTRLRNDAIASLSLIDLELDTQWPDASSQDSYPATDADCERYVRIDGSDVLLCDMNTNQVSRRYALTERMRRYIGFSFSYDGRYLGARFERAPTRERVQIWDVATGASGGVVDVGGLGSASSFTADSRFLIVAHRTEHELRVLDLPALHPARSFRLSGRPATITV
ncbi:MAG: serine/threonine-protein kinase, partial [Pirellulaceae bacterium]